MISPIDQLRAIPTSVAETPEKASQSGSMFQSVLQSTIQNVRVTDANKTEAEYLLATGQLDNPAALTIALSKNQTAVNLLIQLRNKSMEAYTELTRISV